jgi:tetratricopeptide (TPR) repeat protein
MGDRPYFPNFAIPAGAEEAITRLLDQQFGPGRAQLRGVSTTRADTSDEYHEIQLREKPEDPNTHSNYGAFLMDIKGDREGAERAYRKAIELDENHASALGNLASFWCEMWELLVIASVTPSLSGRASFLPSYLVANTRAMVLRLALSTPHPTHLPKPDSPLSRHLPKYPRRFITLMRPSTPAR